MYDGNIGRDSTSTNNVYFDKKNTGNIIENDQKYTVLNGIQPSENININKPKN